MMTTAAAPAAGAANSPAPAQVAPGHYSPGASSSSAMAKGSVFRSMSQRCTPAAALRHRRVVRSCRGRNPARTTGTLRSGRIASLGPDGGPGEGDRLRAGAQHGGAQGLGRLAGRRSPARPGAAQGFGQQRADVAVQGDVGDAGSAGWDRSSNSRCRRRTSATSLPETGDGGVR